MEKKQLFPDMTGEQRLQALMDNAYNVKDNELVTRAFTHEEMQDLKNNLAERSVEYQKEKIEFDKQKKAFEEKTKPVVETIKETTKSLRLHYSERVETVFEMDNQETGFMEVYDADGFLISQRPLRRDEKQLSIASKAAM